MSTNAMSSLDNDLDLTNCSVTKKDIEELKAAVLLVALAINEQNSRCPWGFDISEGFNFYCALLMFTICGAIVFFILFIF